LDVAKMPLIVQFNKRDLPGILSEEEILARWSGAAWPLFFASALEGPGVIQTFAAALAGVYQRLNNEFSLSGDHGLSEAAFVAAAGG
jgi:hypothetical protein